MRKKYMLILIGIVVGVSLSSVVFVLAGTPDSPGAPGATNSYNLEDIYNRLASGADGAQSTFTEPAVAPGTMHTLNETIAKAPAKDDTNGAATGDVLTTKTYWSRRTADWGHQTGTMANNGAVTIVPTTTNQTIAVGYHNGSGYVEGDADLVAGNIRSTVSIFGVSGDSNVVDTSSGTATASEILTDRVAYVGGLEITGTMTNCATVTIVPTTTQQTIAAGYHNGLGKVEGDDDLVAGNIKQSVNIFGVDGTLSAGGGAGVPKTGQTTKYADGDDGDLEKGVAWPSPRFTDNTNGTVTDNLTGLIWLKNANCAGATKNWATALSYSNALWDGCPDCFNGHGDCDLSDGSIAGDWRLPNVRELYSLIHLGQANLANWLNGQGFTGVQPNYYWSSSTHAGGTGNAWSVHLNLAMVVNATKTGGYYYVWPVRDAQ